jgi:methionyl-tRNA formyltransferase
MRIVFFGTGEIGLPTLRMLFAEPGCTIAGVVTQPDKPAGRHQELRSPQIKEVAEAHAVPVCQPQKLRGADVVETLRAFDPELFVVFAYGQILSRAVLDIPSRACLNLHASLLPRHRGAAPIHAAILSGDRETGITVMHMAEKLDAGDIVLSTSLPIRRRETAGTLHDRLAQLAPEALRAALELMQRGELPRIPQDETAATCTGKLDRAHGVIDWTTNARQIERHIRAHNPWPTASTLLPGMNPGQTTRLKVFSAIACQKASGEPGRVLGADQRGLLVGAGEGAVLLREVQLEGKRRMSARDFLTGNRVPIGSILGARA